MLLKFGTGLAAVALITAATSSSADVTLQDRQQAACYNDAQKLCGEFIPNADKTEACMSKMKDRVSPGCRKYYTD